MFTQIFCNPSTLWVILFPVSNQNTRLVYIDPLAVRKDAATPSTRRPTHELNVVVMSYTETRGAKPWEIAMPARKFATWWTDNIMSTSSIFQDDFVGLN